MYFKRLRSLSEVTGCIVVGRKGVLVDGSDVVVAVAGSESDVVEAVEAVVVLAVADAVAAGVVVVMVVVAVVVVVVVAECSSL